MTQLPYFDSQLHEWKNPNLLVSNKVRQDHCDVLVIGRKTNDTLVSERHMDYNTGSLVETNELLVGNKKQDQTRGLWCLVIFC